MTADILAKTISPLSSFLGKQPKQYRQDINTPFLVDEYRQEEYIEDWELKASDALREEILSSYIPVSDEELDRMFNKPEETENRFADSVDPETIPLVKDVAAIPGVEARVQEPETNLAANAPTKEKTLGIFSDSRIYSAMIQHELKQHDVTIKHFNHPASFQPERFDLFDSIDAWMVFLSDDYDGPFLDEFLERYEDKPTLFLFEKSQRRRTSRNIEQFLTENALTTASLLNARE